jgi:hypothetical protein
MFEIYFLLTHIPKRIRALARERKRSAPAWSLLAIAAWVVCEFAVIFIAGVLIAINAEFEKSGWFMFATYVLALGSAGVAASLIISKLRSMPLARGDETP